MRKYRAHEEYLLESLKDTKEAALYLNAVSDEKDPALLLVALRQIAQAHGMTRMANKASMTRMGLYKTLSKKGNPEFKTFLRLLDASGIQMSFKPKMAA